MAGFEVIIYGRFWVITEVPSSLRKDWEHEFQRPIYFLMTRDGYVCGWCELDRVQMVDAGPPSLSRVSSRRWMYRTEIENLGRVVAVAIRWGK